MGKRYIQLDSLRALAFFGVAWQHWSPESHKFGLPWANGVYLFFVLSGFLITSILLKCNEDSQNKFFSLRQFYIKRFLRIFPIYYIVLITVAALNIPTVRETFLWHFFYLSNFYFLYHGGWYGQLGHFWTLAVEEQFYLFWPWVILFLPKRFLFFAITGLIAVAFIADIFLRYLYQSNKLIPLVTVLNFDSLGMGALLAYSYLNKTKFYTVFERHLNLITGTALAMFCLFYYLTQVNVSLPITFPICSISLSVFYAGVVLYAVKGAPGIAGRFLEWPLLVYLGRISYSLYILHMLAVYSVVPTLQALSLPVSLNDSFAVRLLIMSFWTVLGASLSWHFIEKPINDLKKKIPYTVALNT